VIVRKEATAEVAPVAAVEEEAASAEA